MRLFLIYYSVICQFTFNYKVEFLMAQAAMDEMLSGKLKRALVTESMADRTIKALDAYMGVLNKKCDEDYTQELY